MTPPTETLPLPATRQGRARAGHQGPKTTGLVREPQRRSRLPLFTPPQPPSAAQALLGRSARLCHQTAPLVSPVALRDWTAYGD